MWAHWTAFLLFLAPAVRAENGGAKGAITQSLVDKLRDAGLPVALSFVSSIPIGEQGGGWGPWSFKADNIKLTNAAADAKIELTGVDNAVGAVLTMSNLKLDASAEVHFDGLITHLSGSATTNADGSSATVGLAIKVANGVPQISLGSCTADIQIADIDFSLDVGILDGAASALADALKGNIEGDLRGGLCDTGAKALVDNLNTFLSGYSYAWSTAGVLPAPWDKATLDYHIEALGEIDDGDGAAWITGDARAEVYGADGAKSGLAAPALPGGANFQARDASVQASAFPLDTLGWTFFHQDALRYDIPRSVVPSGKWYDVDILDTNSLLYRLLMPKLHEAYPDHNLTMSLRGADAPTVALEKGSAKLAAHLNLTFSVDARPPVEAFSLTCPFATTATADAFAKDGAGYVNASVADVTLVFAEGDSHFGNLGPEFLAEISKPANTLVNKVGLAKLNAFLGKGFALPKVEADIASYHLHVAFTNPSIDLAAGATLVATDADISLKKK